jgi:hypothetical protein
MPFYDRVRTALLKRIDDSFLSITIHFPPPRATLTPLGGTATAPASPMTGAPVTPTLVPAAPAAPERDPVTMKCLWLDVAAARNATLTDDRLRATLGGWVETANAQARVAVRDAALDPDNPWAGTVFESAAYVEFQGRRYRVIGVDTIGTSFDRPATYAVWLEGATDQYQRAEDA